MDPFTLLLLAGATLFLVRKPKPIVPRAPMPVEAPAPSTSPSLPSALAAVPVFLVGGILSALSGSSAEEQAAAALRKANDVASATDYINTGQLDSLILSGVTNVTLIRELIRVFPQFPQFGAPPEILVLIDERRSLLMPPPEPPEIAPEIAPVIAPVSAPVSRFEAFLQSQKGL